MKKLLLISFIAITFVNNKNVFAQTPSLIKDIYVGANQSNSALNGVAYGSGIIFTADNGINGSEIWFSDASVAGTNMIKDINPGTTGSNPLSYFSYNSKLLFTANDASGRELWITDGTLSGTNLVKDINPGAAGSNPANFNSFGLNVLFVASTVAEGGELWLTNGSAGGTVLVKDIWPGIAGSNIVQVTNSGLGYVYFVANNGVNGEELWVSDGSVGGTVLVKDIFPGTGTSNIQICKMAGGLLFFIADNGVNGKELWRSDGTTAGTFMTKDINIGIANTFSGNPYTIVYNNKLFFMVFDPSNGNEMWESNGTFAGTVVNNLTPGNGGTNFVSNLYIYNNNLYFLVKKATNDTMIFYDVLNNVTNCSVVKKFTGQISSDFYNFIQTDNSKFIALNTNVACISTSGENFFVSDGTALGSNIITSKEFCFNFANSVTKIPFIANSWIYPIDNGTGDKELNTINYFTGTPNLIKNINPTANFNAAFNSWNYKNYFLNNKYYFLANDGSTGSELWVTDGTNGGTNLTLDIFPGITNGPVSTNGDFTAIVTANNIFFYANNGSTGRELWALLLATSLKENQNKLFENVFLFPNPANESINFNLSTEYFKEVKVEYVIYNSVGQECEKGRLFENKISISTLADGFYNISLKTPQKTTVLKFIKNE